MPPLFARAALLSCSRMGNGCLGPEAHSQCELAAQMTRCLYCQRARHNQPSLLASAAQHLHSMQDTRCAVSLSKPPPLLLCACSYLVLFLKFIASVVPTIEYDYTMAVGTG